MSQANGASGSAPRPRNMHGVVDRMEEEGGRQEQERPQPPPAQVGPRIRRTARMRVHSPVRVNLGPINYTYVPGQGYVGRPEIGPNEEEDEKREGTWSIASNRPTRRSPSPPPSPPAPRAPPPPRQDVARNPNEGQIPAHDPYLPPRLPRNHPYHFGQRHGENLHRPVYGVPPPPPMGMTREERERVWDIAGGLRDTRVRVRHQEVTMERAFGEMRRMGGDAGMAIDGVRRIEEVIFAMGCVLVVVCTLVAALMFRGITR